jgi:hypothetical protein
MAPRGRRVEDRDMTTRWTDWRKVPETARPAYVEWWRECPPPEFRDVPGADRASAPGFSFFTLPASPPVALFEASVVADFAATFDAPVAEPDQHSHLAADYGNFAIGQGPLPANALNDGFANYNAMNGWLPDAANLESIDPGSVIVGLIDSGIPLGAQRLRKADGTTRFIAAWQQDATHIKTGPSAQTYLPFGRELYRPEINGLLSTHTVRGQGEAAFQEHDFNVAAGLIDMHQRLAGRELAGRTSHGAFVADLAAGADPGKADDLISLIAVNLPNRSSINNSGIFLDYFATYALWRIVELADAVWLKSVTPDTPGPQGFPIVINLSFGQNAGGKDGYDQFCAELQQLNARRKQNGFRPVHVVIPVGNHNLERGNASFRLPAGGGQDEIGFTVMPGDQSSNYLEIWSDLLPNPDGLPADNVPIPLQVSVAPPRSGTTTVPGGLNRGKTSLRSNATANDLARLHCDIRMRPDGKSYRIRYLLCTAPTLQISGSSQETPAGRWSIAVRNTGDKPLRVFAHAQTDQSVHPEGRTGLLPRLDVKDYDRFLPSGRLRDAYAHPSMAGAADLETSTVLMRHGSINATAMSPHVIAVSGHRRTDGRPADYSATGFRQADPPVPDGPPHPVASFTTDDGYAHFGVLGAGAASGSIVAMRGTSFAAAQATRVIADILKVSPDADVMAALSALAAQAESAPPPSWPGATPPKPKVGDGRIPWDRRRRIDRFG